MKKEEKLSLREDWDILGRGIRIWCEICPQFLVYGIICQIVTMALPYFPLYLSARLVNELSGPCRGRQLVFLAVLAVFGTFGLNLLKRAMEGRREVWRDCCFQRMELYIADKQNAMEYRYMEDADAALLREEIYAAAGTDGAGLWRIARALPSLTGNLFNLILASAITFSMFRVAEGNHFSGILAFADSAVCLVLFFVVLILDAALSVKASGIHARRDMEIWSKLVGDMAFLHAYLDLRGEDIAVFNLKDVILKEYEKRALRPPYFKEAEKNNIGYQTKCVLQDAVLTAAVFLLTAAKAYLGVFGIGYFILYRGAVSRFVKALSGIAADITQLRENSRYLQKVYKFLDMPADMYLGSLAVEKRDDIDYEIEFRDVGFQYPGTDTWVLKHVNMKFRIGDKLAIVGENGSGKTTFIKLLCRLYDPTEGVILLNGIDITKYRYQEYMSLFSVVFQDFKLFQFSLAENVAGSLAYDEARVKQCLAKAGFEERLCTLSDGVRSVIGRDYENRGIDLSGGEEQKIALARALYKDAPFVVLDEPAAALDPVAEAAVYENFQALVKDKTAVFISHRLSSCRFCDDIIVFHKGRLVQRGSHDVLVTREGRYCELWNAQAKYYR